MKYSKNMKLNAVLNHIRTDILEHEGILPELARYRAEFPHESDYNFAQYGNLLVYFADVREMYRNCGYKTTERISDSQLWETYRRQVGFVIRSLLD